MPRIRTASSTILFTDIVVTALAARLGRQSVGAISSAATMRS
jgi:hypothetical protein